MKVARIASAVMVLLLLASSVSAQNTINCGSLVSERECTAGTNSNVCFWTGTAGTTSGSCRPVPCANLTANTCPIVSTRCTSSPTGGCTDLDCGRMQNAGDCAANAFGCVFNSAASSASCTRVTPAPTTTAAATPTPRPVEPTPQPTPRATPPPLTPSPSPTPRATPPPPTPSPSPRPVECSMFKDRANCSEVAMCSWNASNTLTTGICVRKRCSQLIGDQCSMATARCMLTASGGCVDKECQQMTTHMDCFENSRGCAYQQGSSVICVPATAAPTTTAAATPAVTPVRTEPPATERPTDKPVEPTPPVRTEPPATERPTDKPVEPTPSPRPISCAEIFRINRTCPENLCVQSTDSTGATTCVARQLNCSEAYRLRQECPEPRCTLQRFAIDAATTGVRCVENSTVATRPPTTTAPVTAPVTTQRPSIEEYCAQQGRLCPAPVCMFASSGKCVPNVVTRAPTTTQLPLPTRCALATSEAICGVMNNCQWQGAWCMDVSCGKYATSETCQANACRWAPSACFDPIAYLRLECAKFTVAAQCSAVSDRCSWNAATGNCVNLAAPTPAPSTRPTGCVGFTDVTNCPMDRCMWTGSSCAQLPCERIQRATLCDAPRCAWDAATSACATPVVCPATAPVFCPLTRLCAATKERCVRCASNEVQCWDSSCAASFDRCPCPQSSPFKCDNGRCALSQANCTVTCSGETPVTCWNNKCAATLNQCDCPAARPTRCPETNVCVVSSDDCVSPNACVGTTSVKCWDGSCAASQLRCPCNPNTPTRCATGECVSAEAMCPCPTGLIKCDGGNTTRLLCARTAAECTATCATGLTKCADSVCRATCPCTKPAEVSLKIDAVAPQFVVSDALRVTAQGTVKQCDQVVSFARIAWSIAPTPTTVTASQGSTLFIAPNTLRVGTTYRITASVTVNNVVTSDTVSINVVAPVPTVTIAGGDRKADIAAPVRLVAQIRDPSLVTAAMPAAQWQCCVPSATVDRAAVTQADCAGRCPSSNATNVVASALSFVPSQLGFAAGNYLFFATYNQVTASTFLSVVATPVVNVELVAPTRPQFTTRNLTLYAVIRTNEAVTIAWTINGRAITTRERFVLLTPADIATHAVVDSATGRLFIKASIAVTSASGVQGTADAVVTLVRPPTGGSCSVMSAAKDATAIFSADKIVISAVNFETDGLQYRFGVSSGSSSDVSSANLRPLSIAYSDATSIETQAPIVREDTTLTFWVQLSMLGERDIAIRYCTATVRRPAHGISAVVATETTRLRDAASAADTTTVVQTAALVATALKDDVRSSAPQSNSTERREAVKEVVRAITETVRSGSEMSRTERGVIVTTLASAAQASNDAITEATAQRNLTQIVREVLRTGSNAESALNAREHAQTLLQVIDKIEDRQEATRMVQNLTLKVATQLEVGEKQEVRTEEVVIVAKKRVADDLASAPVETPNAAVQLPRSFRPANTTGDTPVAISATEHARNPVGTSGIQASATVASPVVEFDVSTARGIESVKGLTEPITITLAIKPEDSTKTLTCVYWDKNKGEWSGEGVTRGAVSSTTVQCNTTHFSMFTVVASTQTTGTGTNDGTDGLGSSSFPTGAVAGVVVGAILLVGLVAGILMSRKKASAAQTAAADNAVPLNMLVEDPYANHNCYGQVYTELQSRSPMQAPPAHSRSALHEL